jgi:hypothetical protein
VPDDGRPRHTGASRQPRLADGRRLTRVRAFPALH